MNPTLLNKKQRPKHTRVRLHLVTLLLLLSTAHCMKAQEMGIVDFLAQKQNYDAGTPTAQSTWRAKGWSLEKRIGEATTPLVEIWKRGAEKGATRARLIASKNGNGSYSLMYWIYDEPMAEKFEQSLKDEGYETYMTTENGFEVVKTYRRTNYDECVKVKRMQNTSRFNQPERQYLITLGDSYCASTDNIYICQGEDWENGGVNQCTYTIDGGQIVGTYSVCDTNGNLLEEVNYIAGQREGMGKKYHTNGQLKELANYKSDLLNGETTRYDSLGHIVGSELWEMGWNSHTNTDGTKLRRFVYTNQQARYKDSLCYRYDKEGHCIDEELHCIKFDGTQGHHISRHYKLLKRKGLKDTLLLTSAKYITILPNGGLYPDEYSWTYYIDATLAKDSIDSIAQQRLRGVGDSALWDSSFNGWQIEYSYDEQGKATEREVRSYMCGRLENMRQYAGPTNPMPLLYSASFHGSSCSIHNRKGTLLSKGGVKGDRRHGKWQHFTDNKQHKPWKEEHYNYGELDSLLTQRLIYDTALNRWRPIRLSANYNNGTLHGHYELLDSAKRTLLKGEYLRGKKIGTWIEMQSINPAYPLVWNDSIWTRNYTDGVSDGVQTLSVAGEKVKVLVYQYGLLRELTTYTDGYPSKYYRLDYSGKDLICKITSVMGDTTWVKTWHIVQFSPTTESQYDNFDIWMEHNPSECYTDGLRMVHKTGDTSVIYAKGHLLHDLHIGEWSFNDYSQEVQLKAFYDKSKGDLLRREYYTDFNGNPYSGSYFYNGGYVNDLSLQPDSEVRDITDGVRTHGPGSHTH